ncbi:MAG: hypothetical protein ACRELV_13090, partial [Longimicrobiales bacterium]
RTMTALVTALTIALAACEPADDQDATLGGDTAAAPLDTAPADVAGEADVTATLTEWQITLSSESVAPGTVMFQVTNEGEYEHAFEVEGNGEEFETDPIAPGSSATLTADLSPGTYEVYCPIVDEEHGSHEELGMTTELVVGG